MRDVDSIGEGSDDEHMGDDKERRERDDMRHLPDIGLRRRSTEPGNGVRLLTTPTDMFIMSTYDPIFTTSGDHPYLCSAVC